MLPSGLGPINSGGGPIGGAAGDATAMGETGRITTGGITFAPKSSFPGGNAGALVAGLAVGAVALLALAQLTKGGRR